MTDKKRLFAVLTTALAGALPLAASADALGFRVGAYRWMQAFDGTVEYGPDKIDIEDTLGLDDDDNNVYFFALEHPIPILPNVMLSRTEIDVSATNDISETFTFNDETFVASDTVRTEADLSHTDLTLYYEILDNWVSLDIGLTVRAFDGGITLRSTTESADLDLDGAIPLLYAAVKFDLPLTGLYAGGDINAISYNDSAVTDYKINLGYEMSFGLGVEAGFRSFHIDYEDEDDSDEKADITIDGAYLGVFYHF